MGNFVFFFFKQKTAYEISSRDWSSDVCSSDLRSCKSASRSFWPSRPSRPKACLRLNARAGSRRSGRRPEKGSWGSSRRSSGRASSPWLIRPTGAGALRVPSGACVPTASPDALPFGWESPTGTSPRSLTARSRRDRKSSWVSLSGVSPSDPPPNLLGPQLPCRGSEMAPVLTETEGLVKDYRVGTQVVHALRGVSAKIEVGEFVAVMGASGSGKSTFINMLGCLDTPTGGRYLFEGEDVSRFNRD